MSTDLGIVELLGAEAVGQPGQRRFRLFARSSRGTAVMWMEKEQLSTLSVAVDRLLAHITEGQVLRVEAQAAAPEPSAGMPADFPGIPGDEFQVAQLRLTYNEQSSLFLLIAVPLEIIMMPGEEVQPRVREDLAVSLSFTLEQAQELTGSITRIVGSGRPVCPLCGMPLDDGPHMCEKQNGHREIIQVIEEGGEGEE